MSEEERRAKFVKLAQARTNNAIKQIKLIGNLSNRGNYSYTEKDVDKIYKALHTEVRMMKARFDEGEKSNEPGFTL